jgi:hypothetical protein
VLQIVIAQHSTTAVSKLLLADVVSADVKNPAFGGDALNVLARGCAALVREPFGLPRFREGRALPHRGGDLHPAFSACPDQWNS